MIPLGGMLIMGPPTQRMQKRLSYVKWCVIATYACAVGRFVANDPFGALNDVFGALFGTFLLKEDPVLQGCYRCLHESPLGAMSEGGMACLLPYTFMAGLNGLFSSVRVYTIMNKFGTLLPCAHKLVCLLPLWLVLSSAAQLFAVWLCWKVYKQMQQQAFSGIYMNPEAPEGGGLQGPTPTPPGGGRAAGPAEGGQPGPAATREPLGVAGGGGASGGGAGSSAQLNPFIRSQFTPFQGPGHHLTMKEDSGSDEGI